MDTDNQSSKYSDTQVNVDGIPLEDRNNIQIQTSQIPLCEERGQSQSRSLAPVGRMHRWLLVVLGYLNRHSWPKFVIALLLGGGTTAATTIAVIYFVHRLIASASLDTRAGREASMRQAAIIYDRCYKDFEWSHDLNRSFNACQRTSQIKVPNTVCDGYMMWTWRERYPEVCLQALGRELWPKAFKQLSKEYRSFYGLFVLTVFAGLIIYIVVVWTWEPMVVGLSKYVINVSDRARAAQQDRPAENVAPGRKYGGRRFLPWYWCAQVLVVATLVGTSNAFPCWRHDFGADARLSFVSVKNELLWGQIHGWTLDCEEKKYVCGQDCSWNRGTKSNNCIDKWCSKNIEVQMPSYYVLQVWDSVAACGFREIGHGTSQYVESTLTRVANPLLEKNHWVSISMMKLNLTDVTDPSVMCLWEIGNQR